MRALHENPIRQGFMFEHSTIEALLRELRRNSQLRKMCGFESKTKRLEDGNLKIYLAPSKSSYSKFLANLKECGKELDGMFAEMGPSPFVYHIKSNSSNLDTFMLCL